MLLPVAVLAIVLFVSWFSLTRKKRASMPPGEWGWPIIGQMPSTDQHMDETIKDLRKKHGDIFTWKIGAQTFVILCDFQMIKDAFNHGDANDRPNWYSLMIFTNYEPLGLFNVNGERWQVGRRFTIRHLRDMGMGRTALESSMAFEAHSLVEDFSKHTDKVTTVPGSLSIAILNIIWKITADKRFDLDDQEALEFQKVVVQIFHEFQENVGLFDSFPYLVPLTPLFVMEMLGVKRFMDHCKQFMDYMRKCVAEHKATLDPAHPRDYIDAFLIEMQHERNVGSDIFTEENLAISVGDIFSAASETTSITLRWFILYMMKYPEIQKKIQEEIDGVVPRDRLPGLDDRPSLNLTCAALYEVERVAAVTPLLAPHQVTKDMEISGFQIPKGVILMGHIGSCHTDPTHWERPNDFYPQHFLDAEGKFCAKKDGFLPFSIGRRVCPGETLARQTMFLLGASLVHSFSFEAPEGAALSTERDPSEKFIVIPKPFQVIMRKRN